jgi:archaeal flagellar protein FlaJ
MVLSWREIFVLKLRMRYKFKRVYLTLALPAAIAIIIFSYALYTGFAPLPNLGAVSTGASASTGQLSGLQEYELLYPNQTASSPGAPPPAAKPAAPPNPQNFNLVLVVGLIIGLGPYSYDATRKDRELRRNEADFTDFLFELSELVRGGIDPVKAINTLAQGTLGSITKNVQMVAKQMQIGYTFEEAMRNLADGLHSPLIEKYVDLVIQASYSGGTVANLIQRASADMGIFLGIEREKRAGLSQYTLILYTAQVILIALSAILVVQFLPDLASISSIGSTALAGSILGQADIGSVPLQTDLFFLVVINGFLGGLVIGKISESKVKHGIKHALILVLIGFLAWTLFVVPATSGAGVHYNYSVLSYDKTGDAGIPLKDPVVVQVNNTDGTPAVGVLVTFGLIGPGGTASGTIVPTTADTDSSGQASAVIVLGSTAGVYSLDVTVNDNTTVYGIVATSAGDGA